MATGKPNTPKGVFQNAAGTWIYFNGVDSGNAASYAILPPGNPLIPKSGKATTTTPVGFSHAAQQAAAGAQKWGVAAHAPAAAPTGSPAPSAAPAGATPTDPALQAQIAAQQAALDNGIAQQVAGINYQTAQAQAPLQSKVDALQAYYDAAGNRVTAGAPGAHTQYQTAESVAAIQNPYQRAQQGNMQAMQHNAHSGNADMQRAATLATQQQQAVQRNQTLGPAAIAALNAQIAAAGNTTGDYVKALNAANDAQKKTLAGQVPNMQSLGVS